MVITAVKRSSIGDSSKKMRRFILNTKYLLEVMGKEQLLLYTMAFKVSKYLQE